MKYRDITRALKRCSAGERGFILPMAIIALVVGSLVVIPLLVFVSTSASAFMKLRERELALLANEAAINRVAADLRRGADAIPASYYSEQPHAGNASFQTFTFTTTYTVPAVTLNGYSPAISISDALAGGMPAPTQQYFDPGVVNPELLTVPGHSGYLMRLFNVRAGTLQVNWAYSPAASTRIIVYRGIPVDNQTGQPYPPGRVTSRPIDPPVLDTSNSPGNQTYNRTASLNVTPGVYTIVFFIGTSTTVTTMPFAASGATGDTWIYAIAHRDYSVTAESGGFITLAYLRQVPGYSQPPTGGWSTTNPSWVPNRVYVRTITGPVPTAQVPPTATPTPIPTPTP